MQYNQNNTTGRDDALHRLRPIKWQIKCDALHRLRPIKWQIKCDAPHRLRP